MTEKKLAKVDRVEKDSIFLDGEGYFPKDLIIIDRKGNLKYRIIKTKNGKYQLVK